MSDIHFSGLFLSAPKEPDSDVMQTVFVQYIILIVIILGLLMVSQKLRIAYPIVLVVGGLALSMFDVMPGVTINPELILIIFLPPLLYEAAWQTSWKELWRWRRVVGSFAVLIVILTSTAVAFVSNAIIPGFPLALGFLLGGIVSPPDAVSATSILKFVKVPKRVTAVIEGESLLNDASSLVVFRFAMVAVTTGQFIFHQAALSFTLVIVMGIAIGYIVALVFYFVHRLLPTDSNMDIVLTLLAPYIMYIAAESFHFSGVLSVVTGGLYLSYRSHKILTNRSRIQANNVWATLSFVLNGLVFILIGLELRAIVTKLGTASLGEAITYGLIISAVLIVGRMMCTFGASLFTMFIKRFITVADSNPGWKAPTILGWAGMRGVVSLAAALSIPLTVADGTPFPFRNLILFITFVVILVTLLLQGLTLPLVIKWVAMEDPDKHIPIAEEEKNIRKALADHSIEFLKSTHGELLKTNAAVLRLQQRYETDQQGPNELDVVEEEKYREVYLAVLNQQRDKLEDLNKIPETDEDLIRKYHGLLDLEEEKLRVRFEG